MRKQSLRSRAIEHRLNCSFNVHCCGPKSKYAVCKYRSIVRENGARGRDRTTDTAIFSRMLYQLSYPGAAGPMGLASAGL
jgi:hypothetical protein